MQSRKAPNSILRKKSNITTSLLMLYCKICAVFSFLSGRNDYGVRSLESILDMVKVMSFALQEGKVIHSRTELMQDRPNRHRLFVTLVLL